MDEFRNESRRVLLVDDNPAIHHDVRKVFAIDDTDESAAFDAEDDELFGFESPTVKRPPIELDHAHSGEEAIPMVRAAFEEDRPYAVAIVDMRMPPGIDGLETVQRCWQEDWRMLVTFCTAFSDYSSDEMQQRLERTDRFVLLRKPFEKCEIQQLVDAMVARWQSERLAEVNVRQVTDLLTANRELERELETLRMSAGPLEETGPDSHIGQTCYVVDRPGPGRDEVARALSDAGCRVRAFDEPFPLVQSLTSEPYDPETVVVMEMAAGNNSGYDAVRTLRSEGFQGRIAAFTRHQLTGDRENCLATGCDFYVPKSCGPQLLVRELALLLSLASVGGTP